MSIDRILLTQQSVINTIDNLQDRLNKTVSSDEDIHQVRVDIKHLRSWLRLLQIETADIHWKTMDARLAKIAKSLSIARDSHVINKTLSVLEISAITKKERLAISRLKEKQNVELVQGQIDWNMTRQILLEELIAFKYIFISFESMHAVNKGLKHTYKKAIKNGQKAFFKSKSIDDLHGFRKWAKYLNYQLDYISKVSSGYCNQTKLSLHELGELLGTANDLNMIYNLLAQTSYEEDSIRDLEVITGLLNKHLNQILKNSKHIYKSAFSLSPKIFIRKINNKLDNKKQRMAMHSK